MTYNQVNNQTQNIEHLQLMTVIEDMFMVLSPKEKDVVIKRFSLDNGPRQTLEKIGQSFSVTRERVRQIEKIALGKLRRTIETTKIRSVNQLALDIVNENGGLLIESKLINELIKRLNANEICDVNILKLALNINSDLLASEKNLLTRPYWKVTSVSNIDIRETVLAGLSILNKKGDVLDSKSIISDISTVFSSSGKNLNSSFILSALETDKRIKRVAEGFGLVSWRHINPRSIRDKAYIVLKRAATPLHFVEISNRISSSGFDKKVVTTQAVHNELIRYDQFVLVGRGLYALKEWGYKKGTVSEVIESLLRKKSPLTKQEIINGVLKQRRVKKGTISLNLQKNSRFVRVGRAVYDLVDNLNNQ